MITFPYKTLSTDENVSVDLYLPNTSSLDDRLPAVVYFHGGGLTVGDRTSWFPFWLQRRVNSAGWVFASADHSLLPSGGITAKDIIKDIQDVFAFLRQPELFVSSEADSSKAPRLDPSRVAVAGTSSGGLLAYLSAIHVQPKPIRLLSMYGMGGDFLTDHYLRPKTEVFFRGRELLNPSDFSDLLYPTSISQPAISASQLSYHQETGYPTNKRMQLTRLYLQLGIFLDYYTGQHEQSLCRDVLQGNPVPEAIPEELRSLFPQCCASSEWPETLLVHGTEDTAVKVEESRHFFGLLKQAGVEVTLEEIEGKEHSFDYVGNAEEELKDCFDRWANFLTKGTS